MRIPTDKVTLMLGICLIGLWFMVGEMTLVASHLKIYISPAAKRNGPWTVGIPVMEGCLKKIPAMYKSRIHPIDLIEWNGRIGCPPKTESLYYHPKHCAIEGEPLKMTIHLHCLITPQMGNSSWFPANYNANHRANFRSSVFRSPAPRVFNDDSDSSGAIWPHGGKKNDLPMNFWLEKDLPFQQIQFLYSKPIKGWTFWFFKQKSTINQPVAFF